MLKIFFRPYVAISMIACALLVMKPSGAAAQRDLTVHKIGPCQLVQSDGGFNSSVGGWVRGLCDTAEITNVNGATVQRKDKFYVIQAEETGSDASSTKPVIRELVIGEKPDFTPLITARLAGGEKLVIVSYRDIPCEGPGKQVIALNYGAVPKGKISLFEQGDAALGSHFTGAACRAI